MKDEKKIREIMNMEEIEKRWPFLFPLDRTNGERIDALIQANRDSQYLIQRVKELEAESSRIRLGMGDDYGDDPVAVFDTLKTRVKQLEEQVKDLLNTHAAGCREAYRICGVEDDGEYRWKWVLLELSSRVQRVKELEEGVRQA